MKIQKNHEINMRYLRLCCKSDNLMEEMVEGRYCGSNIRKAKRAYVLCNNKINKMFKKYFSLEKIECPF